MNEFEKKFAKLLNALALIAIALYRTVGALWLSGSCRFEPSCSVYAQEAFQRHGFYVGLRLTWSRLLRCRPGGDFGYDPVPEHECEECKRVPV